MNYIELHLHDYYSTLDGLNSPAEYFARAEELGMTHLPQTNHGTLLGHREFQEEAKKAGIVPILGEEAYISPTDRFDRRSKAKRTDGTSAYNHIILLAQNETGLQTLYRLNEIAWTEGFYHKPRIDMEALEEHNEGLIVLSGCLNGLLCKALEAGDFDGAVKIAHRLKSIFKDRFFIEVQSHNPLETNQGLLRIADAMNIRPVITSDCHYARKEDLWIEEAMLILATNPKPNFKAEMSKAQKMDVLDRFNYLYPDRKMTFQEIEIYLRSAEEHLEAMGKQGFDRTDIITNTVEVADMIGEYPYHQGLDLLPVPKTGNPHELLVTKANEGLKELGLADDPKYIERINEELEIIKNKDFSTYFLILANVIAYAQSQGIMVGPGRGSAAGSLVCYALGIIDVDPIKDGLLFFRFINPERNDFPDIDTDFEDRRRGEIKEYLRRQFKNVAAISTVARLGGKNALKDASKVYRVPLAEVNKAIKGIDAPSDKPDLFWAQFNSSPRGREFSKKYPEVIKLAEEMRDRIRSTGIHASGVVMSKEPLSIHAPIESAKEPNSPSDNRVPVVALDMNQAADLGLIKLDILGLKALSILDDTVEMIEARHGKKVNLRELPLDDPNIYNMLSDGYTKGVFQCEQGPYTSLILQMGGVRSFAELAATNALVRPGAANTIGPEYIARKNGQHAVKYLHPLMQPFTEETYGEVLYQEQVMLTMTELAGMSMSDADRVRKIIGKKKDVSEFDAYKDKFVEGASKNITKAQAEKLWKAFEAHAGYSFNKSHAVAYSKISYWTAWLKFYYPLEFVYAILKNEGDKDARTDYLIEAKRLGLRILLPHINKSDLDFSISGDAIRFGLKNIKGIADISGNRLLDLRPFGSYGQLAKAVDEDTTLNVGVLKSMNAIGAAKFEDNPLRGDERDNFYEYLGIPAFQETDLPPKVKAQFRPLDEYEDKGCFAILGTVRKIKSGTGWSRIDIVDETGGAGVFHNEDTQIESGKMYAMLVADNRIARFVPIEEVTPDSDNTFVQFLFSDGDKTLTDNFYQVVAFTIRKTKADKYMATAVFADSQKEMVSALVFPGKFHKAHKHCVEGGVTGVEFSQTDDGAIFVKEVF